MVLKYQFPPLLPSSQSSISLLNRPRERLYHGKSQAVMREGRRERCTPLPPVLERCVALRYSAASRGWQPG